MFHSDVTDQIQRSCAVLNYKTSEPLTENLGPVVWAPLHADREGIDLPGTHSYSSLRIVLATNRAELAPRGSWSCIALRPHLQVPRRSYAAI